MEADKKKKFIMIGGAAILFLAMAYYLLGDQISFKKSRTEEQSVTTVLPEAEEVELTASKSDIYRAKTQRERDAESYFAGLGREGDGDFEDISLTSESVSAEPVQVSGKTTHDAMATLFSDPVVEEPVAKPAPKKTSSSGGGGSKKTSTVATMSAEEKMEFDRKRAEMMRDVLMGAEGTESETSVSTQDVVERISTESAIRTAKPSSLISSLDDDAFDEPMESAGEDRPVRCIFVRDEKIKNGQRVTIRLLEDLTIDGILVPANSHLSATCTIGDRLSMRITSIEQRGHIYSLSMDAYDIDGSLGIYCPETGSTRNNSTIKNNAVTAATSTIGGMVGRVAGTIVNTGASLVRNSSGDVTVSISSGYEFYIMKTKKR